VLIGVICPIHHEQLERSPIPGMRRKQRFVFACPKCLKSRSADVRQHIQTIRQETDALRAQPRHWRRSAATNAKQSATKRAQSAARKAARTRILFAVVWRVITARSP
jgi:t-SNARE complex subunit (syntaxin)